MHSGVQTRLNLKHLHFWLDQLLLQGSSASTALGHLDVSGGGRRYLTAHSPCLPGWLLRLALEGRHNIVPSKFMKEWQYTGLLLFYNRNDFMNWDHTCVQLLCVTCAYMSLSVIMRPCSAVTLRYFISQEIFCWVVFHAGRVRSNIT